MLNSIIGCLGYNWTLSIHPFRDINRQICIDVDPHSYDPLSLINIIVNRPINQYVRMVKRADGSSTSSFSSIISLLWCTVGVARLEGPSTHVIYRRFCCFFSFRFSFFFFGFGFGFGFVFLFLFFDTRLLLVYFISPFLTVSLIVLVSTVWGKSGRINKCVCEEDDILN